MVRRQPVAWGALFAALVQGCSDRGLAQDDDGTSGGGTTGAESSSTGSSDGGPVSTGPLDESSSDSSCGVGMVFESVDVDAASVQGYAPGEPLPLDLCTEVCELFVYESLECTIASGSETGGTTETPADMDDPGAESSSGGSGSGESGSGESGSGESGSGDGTGTTTDPGATVTLECTYSVWSCDTAGRRSAGLVSPRLPTECGALGRYFAAMAHNEAASVVSFVRLQGELAAHGAPADLLEQVRRAARDEVRHARVMGRLARNHGAQPVRPTHVDVGVRPLAEIARENAIEGCVAETWSALLCTWQARHSVDPEIAAALRQIAVDETRHAELAWSLAAWMRGRLDAATNASIDAEREAAAATLVPSLEITMGASARAALGLPSTEAARILASGLQAAMAA